MVAAGTELLGALPRGDPLTDVALVVPCFNEAERLDDGALLRLVDGDPGVHLILVDDGSEDATASRLLALSRARPRRIAAISLARNGGKAEAVRQGLLRALREPVELFGYFDADLSTPIPELIRLIETIRQTDAAVVMGSRLLRLGSTIQRNPIRHYLGRIFASAASLLLQVRVYDTQCGAKQFRRTPAFEAALEERFLSLWAFDVELLGRLLVGGKAAPGLELGRFLEVPLVEWRDVAGSKLKVRAMTRTARDLVAIGLDLRRRRRDRGDG